MTDLLIENVGDSWVNSGRTGQNYGSTNRVQVKSGERWAYLLPELPNIAGRTVLDAYLVGRAAASLSSQTLTVAPITERWSPGRLTYTNRPAINSAADFTESVGVTAAGATVTIDDSGLASIIQAVADGTKWYGLRIATDAATAQSFVATDSGDPAWELVVVLSDAPEVPDNLRPNGGAIPTGVRTVAWDFLDLGGDSSEQAESKVQVDTPAAGVDPDEVSPDYDSGWVVNADPQYLVPAGPTFSTSSAAPSFWRVNVKDVDGNESGWSDWAEFSVAALPTLVMDSPTGPFGDPTPRILAHLTGGTIKAWKIRVTGQVRSNVRADSGLRTGAVDWTVPERLSPSDVAFEPLGVGGPRGRVLLDNRPAWINVRVWDTVDRAVAVGANDYVETWIEVEWDDDDTVDPVTNLAVGPASSDGSPMRTWQWDRTEAADAFLIQVDGVTVARLDDLTPTAGHYEWTDGGEVAPYRPQELAVRAVEGEARSVAATIDNDGEQVIGLWLIPDDDIDPIVLDGTAVSNFSRTDYRATYTNQEGEEIDIFYGAPPRGGSFEGSVDTSQDDVWAALDRIEALRQSRNRTARLVWGSQSILARIRDIDATPADDILPTNLRHVVRFNFVGLD